MSGIKSEKDLLQALSTLPREVAPQRDVWSEISNRIEGAAQDQSEQPDRKRWWPAAIAASLTAVMFGGYLIMQVPFDGSPLQTEREAVSVSENDGVMKGLAMSRSSAMEESEYQAAFREFLAMSPGQQPVRWPGFETINSGWVTMQQAEIELAMALRDQPENRVLNSRMAALRARQLDLLQQIAAMEMASRRNTT